MKQIISTFLLIALLFTTNAICQPVTNKGKEFWVAYPANQLKGDETYRLYLSATNAANVTVEIPCLNWRRNYAIPAGMVKVSDTIPHIARHDYTGKYCDAIKITSDVSIVAYAHCFGSASSGASLLLPINSWTFDYQCLTYQENWGQGSYSNFYFVAKENDTKVLVKTIDNPDTPFYVTLNKGEWYQYTSNNNAQVDLTGSSVTVVPNSSGVKNPIAFFSCASRTLNSKPCGGGGDFIMQQNFPKNAWGNNYLTAPAIQSNGLTYQANLFRIQLFDSSSNIYINGKEIYPNFDTSLNNTISYYYNNVLNANYLEYLTIKPTHVKSNNPIMVAQYFSGACGNTVGDPEMIYLSPLEQSINKANFYRNDSQVLNSNHVTLIGDANDSIKIYDGGVLNNWTKVYPHPAYPGKSIYEKTWIPAAKKQVTVFGNKNFTGITYGLGSVESYGYNIGSRIGNAFELSAKGKVFYDNNKNGVFDNNDVYANGIRVQLNDSNYAFTDVNGYYELPVDSSGYYSVEIKAPSYFNSLPNPINTIVPKFDSIPGLTNNLVALQSITNQDSIKVSILPAWNNVANAQSAFLVYYYNTGTSLINANVNFNYDPVKFNFDSCSDITSVHVNPTINLIRSNMQPGEIRSFIVYLTNKSNVILDDTLNVNVCANILGTNITSCDSNYTIIASPFVTNNAQATKAMSLSNAQNGKPINFTLRFRNNTNERIENVYIVDTISNLLNAKSVEILQSSFPCKASINGNILKITFNNINLPSNQIKTLRNFGFVTFRIKTKSTIANGDLILNNAEFYFDYNDAVKTNTTKTVINLTGTILPVKTLNFSINKKESSIQINWNTIDEKNVKHFIIQRSFDSKDFKTVAIKNAQNNLYNNYQCIDELINQTLNYDKIFYRIIILDNSGTQQISEIKSISFSKIQAATLFPNPVKNNLSIIGQKISQIEMYNINGKIVLSKKLEENASVHSINTESIDDGIYYIKLSLKEGKTETQTIIIKH